MSRLIDADALIEAMGEEPYVWTDSAEEIAERNQWLTDIGIIENAPTIDAVSVVRCKECKWEQRCDRLVHHNHYDRNTCAIYSMKVEYCSEGERKEP